MIVKIVLITSENCNMLGFLTLQPLTYPYPSKPLTLGWGQGYEGDRVRGQPELTPGLTPPITS